MATEESEDTLMVNEPKEMAVIYDAVHEAQAQNTDDIMSANKKTLENDTENRYGLRSNHCNLRPCCKPTYSNLSLNTVSHESGD
jgi:hypothetical protein